LQPPFLKLALKYFPTAQTHVPINPVSKFYSVTCRTFTPHLSVIQEGQRRKAPKGKPKSPRSLRIRSFLKIHFINPPEVQGQVFGLVFYQQDNDGAKISKSPIWVNRKIAEIVPVQKLQKSTGF
jgi:hypothetical protein